MKLTSFQIVVYIIFIICIVLISYYYTNQHTNQHTNRKEGFNDSNENNESNKSNENNENNDKNKNKNKDNDNDNDNDNNDSNEELTKDITENLERLNITDSGIQTAVINYITSFIKFLSTYKKVEVPITVNNNGLCEKWGSYNNGAYKNQQNNCIKINDDTQCLSNNKLVSCSNYYNDGRINKLSNMNIENIINTVKYNIFTEINGINADINKKNQKIKKILDDLILKRNLENQQKYFINYNTRNLEDKKILLNKNSIDFEKSENEVNVNKIQFEQNTQLNKTTTNRMNLYYNIIIWLIILLIIVGLMNFAFSETE
jgi:hypothetical protein